jgi:hypothetical protein
MPADQHGSRRRQFDQRRSEAAPLRAFDLGQTGVFTGAEQGLGATAFAPRKRPAGRFSPAPRFTEYRSVARSKRQLADELRGRACSSGLTRLPHAAATIATVGGPRRSVGWLSLRANRVEVRRDMKPFRQRATSLSTRPTYSAIMPSMEPTSPGSSSLEKRSRPSPKLKGWDWILVGKEGTGIGYVPISMLAPEDKYVAPLGYGHEQGRGSDGSPDRSR